MSRYHNIARLAGMLAILTALGAEPQPAPSETPSAGESAASGAPAACCDDTADPFWTPYHRGVAGTAHDFTSFGGFSNACSACHVPHVQAIRPTSQPSTQPAVEMFRIGGQRQILKTGWYTPGPTSLICLSCHDGTVAMSTIGSAHAMLAGRREGFAVPDGFAWRDHPIGVPYPSGRRDYRPEAFVSKTLRLPNGRIECITCHDPHNESGLPAMLSVSNKRSALCLTCHVK